MKRKTLAVVTASTLAGLALGTFGIISSAQAGQHEQPLDPSAATQKLGDPTPNGEDGKILSDGENTPVPQDDYVRPPDGGEPVDSPEAAIALALRDTASIKEVDSTRAVQIIAGELYSKESLLPQYWNTMRPPDLIDQDPVWLVAVTGEIRPSFSAAPLTFEYGVYIIDGKTGSVLGTNANNGKLPAVFNR